MHAKANGASATNGSLIEMKDVYSRIGARRVSVGMSVDDYRQWCQEEETRRREAYRRLFQESGTNV